MFKYCPSSPVSLPLFHMLMTACGYSNMDALQTQTPINLHVSFPPAHYQTKMSVDVAASHWWTSVAKCK